MRAVLDACVLYPTVLREILIGVAADGQFEPVWSDRLLEEWARTAEKRGGPADGLIARGAIATLSARFPSATTPEAGPDITNRLWLPDTGDIHVLATAIQAEASTIVTLNLRDFPMRELEAHGVRALHPDVLLTDLWLSDPDRVTDIVGAVHDTAQSLSGAAMPLRALLKRARLPRLGKALTR